MNEKTNSLLRLHTDSNSNVWCGYASIPVTNTQLDAYAFFSSDVYSSLIDSTQTVRLLGSRNNAALVVCLQRYRVSSHPTQIDVQLGSPDILRGLRNKEDMSDILHHLWHLPSSHTLSGMWHKMTDNDFQTYAMIDAIDTVDMPVEVSDVVKRMALEHPAWPVMTFTRIVSDDAACRLLCDIIDPRWYKHQMRISRHNRLHMHLGLTPKNARAYLDTACDPGVNFDRASTAINAWYNPIGKTKAHDYLQRVFCKYTDTSQGLLRATQCFVNLISHVWLSSIYPPNHPLKFEADKFFTDRNDAISFEQHLNKNNKPV